MYTVTHPNIATYQISSQYIKGRQRKVRTTSNLNKKYKFKSHNSAKNHSTGTNSSLNSNSSRYSQIPNIKSIYQRTSRKSPDNLTFEQKYKCKGHKSAKSHSTGTKFELNCNTSRYSHIPNIKSIYQRTSNKSPNNFKFEQYIQVRWP